MLYDQRRAKTKADPFSLESLIAWLEMQPADGCYNFIDCDGGCLLDRYLHSIGEPDPIELHLRICGGLKAYQSIGAVRPHTFGAALTRARAVLTERAGA